ncbi:protein BatD [Myroides marinus]|uniref:BatD family protein n=1 Tax=Myroides marinus TaxID=703342 RepID=UPI00257720D8|nr:BatD family protein [Myroides marinus]MDM1350761.1 protein BatD [Myroides marinus]MDM1354549.1 protein BatD [Myroides marinus]MDM1357968.1 protein BatD [Myroides marinus]MDM1365315.1 protein BatD [Myroides marinus]MDM1379723.1 protein BatD [Myroides marinus]
MKTLRYYILLIALICTQAILAQVSFEAAVSRDNIPLNENIRVDFAMNQDGDNFAPPRFDNFTVVGGPNQSVSYSWVNGKKSFNKTYSYFLQAKKKGTFTIGAASIEIEGQVYKTKPISVTITDAVVRQDPRQQQYNQVQQQALADIHLVAEVSNTNPYINEPLTITYKLYFNTNIAGFTGQKIPNYEKFWVHNVELPKRPDVKIGKFKGKETNFIVLKQDVLMPQEAGTLTIDPLVLLIQAEIPTGRRDFFGYPEFGYMEKDYSTGKITIRAKDLPEAGKPANFSGGVGTFDFKVTPTKTSLKAGEQLNLKLEVSGKGNLNLLTMPTPTAHSALEMYDPTTADKITSGTGGMQGSRISNYTIIPQYKGDYAIDPMEFSYFDLNSKKYKTINIDSLAIHVLDGPMLPKNNEAKNTTVVDKNELFQANATKASIMKPYSSTYWDTTLFYILTALPFVLIPCFILLITIRRRSASDLDGIRLRNNNRLAKKYLGEAKKNINNKELFYEALERCLHNFLKAKLDMVTSEMSNDNITEILVDKNITEEAIKGFMDLKNACEWARYAPTDQVNINKDYDTAITVISELEKQFK